MAKVLLATGLIVGYSYLTEFFTAWYSGVHWERFAFLNRPFGPYRVIVSCMFFCNVFAPQLLWSKRLRQNLGVLFFVAMCVNCGMWFERFVIIVISLHRDFLPSSWAYYLPTWVDVSTFMGTFGLFFTLFLLFMRFLPMIAISEVKGVTPYADPHTVEGGAKGGQH
jgi:molybdopterin-containing oxidoreductase family membrane subunit